MRKSYSDDTMRAGRRDIDPPRAKVHGVSLRTLSDAAQVAGKALALGEWRRLQDPGYLGRIDEAKSRQAADRP